MVSVTLDWKEKYSEKLPTSTKEKIADRVRDLKKVLIEASDFLYAMQNTKTGSLKWVSFGVHSEVKLPLDSSSGDRPMGSVNVELTDDAPNILFLAWRPASRYTGEDVPKTADLAKGYIRRDDQDKGSSVDSLRKLARWLRFR